MKNRSHLHWFFVLALWLVILISAVGLPARLKQLQVNYPIISRWFAPDDQYRLLLGDVPYDALVAADAILPHDASVLLVTSGEDVRHLEYTTFHRALYFLAPRPVWWVAPAPPDGTWESRWWQHTPLTEEAIRQVITTRNIDCILALDTVLPAGVGVQLAHLDALTLWQVPNREHDCAGSGVQPTGVSTIPTYWALKLFFAVSSALGLGLGLLAFAIKLNFQPHPLEMLGLSWVLGAGMVSMIMLWLNAIGLSLAGQVAGVTFLAVVGFVAAWRLIIAQRTGYNLPCWKWRSLKATRPRIVMGIFLFALLSFHIVYVLIMVTGRPFTIWDSWVNWGMKAHIIFREGGVTPALYADLSRAVTLLDYPLHVPVLEAWFFRWLGAPDDRLVGIIFWLYYLSLPMVVYGVGRRWGASGIIPLLAATAIATLGHVVGLAASAFTDLILAVLVTMAAIYLIDWLIGARPGVLFLGAIAAGLLPWIKREGLVLFIVLLLAFLFAIVFARRLHRRSPPWRRVMMAIIAYSLAAMIIAGPWWIFAGREAVANGAFLPLSPATFFANAERLPTIGWLMTTQLLRPEFGFIWLLMLLASFFALRKRFLFREAIFALPIAAFLYLFLMGLIYVFSDFFPYQQHVLASTFRLGSQVAPLLIIWLAFGLKANREEVL